MNQLYIHHNHMQPAGQSPNEIAVIVQSHIHHHHSHTQHHHKTAIMYNYNYIYIYQCHTLHGNSNIPFIISKQGTGWKEKPSHIIVNLIKYILSHYTYFAGRLLIDSSHAKASLRM